MAPALADGDIVLVRLGAAARPGDVVLVRWPSRPQQLSIKRAVRLEDAGWFVRGDNDFGSTDSRQLGPAAVLGVVRWRIWPRPGRVVDRRTVGSAGKSSRGGSSLGGSSRGGH